MQIRAVCAPGLHAHQGRSDLFGLEPWTPFLDRFPLVLKCYHASDGEGPVTQSAGAGDDGAARGRFCS